MGRHRGRPSREMNEFLLTSGSSGKPESSRENSELSHCREQGPARGFAKSGSKPFYLTCAKTLESISYIVSNPNSCIESYDSIH